MALHTYTKTEYKNAPDHKTTPLNATNLNNSEDGIENAYIDIKSIYDETGDLIAPRQETLTADRAYSIGDQFIYGGKLYKVTAAISSGGTITIGTNASLADNVTNQINNNPIKGSNANGTYVKYVDGTMICTKNVKLSPLAVNTSWGTCYESALTSLGDFAEEFNDVPIVTITNHGSVGAWFEYLLNTSKTYVGDVRMVAPVSVGSGTFNIHVIAIGKWK